MLRFVLPLLVLVPLPLQADRLLCLGTRPGFMFTVETDTATFDYLGDGRYRFEPPLTALPDSAASQVPRILEA